MQTMRGPVQIYGPVKLTIVAFTQVRQLVCFTEVVHEVSQAGGVQMCGMVSEEGADELSEPEVQEQRSAVCPRARTHFRNFQI